MEKDKINAKQVLKIVLNGIVLSYIMAILLLFAGEIIIAVFPLPLQNLFGRGNVTEMLEMYLSFIPLWIVFLIVLGITKYGRPYLKTCGTKPKGNTLAMLGVGLLIGFGMNSGCVVVAILTGSIELHFSSFNILALAELFVAVFIQSAYEEVLTRGFLYQRILKISHCPVLAIVVSAVFFSRMHLANPGISTTALISIFVVGLLFAMMVYYFDSLWCAMAAHAAWNFTQNILYGLPNSGSISTYSLFKLNADTAKNGIAYSVEFGVESSIVAIIILTIMCVVIYCWGQKHPRSHYDIWQK